MKNIFENAYFGKPYKTRDGRKAILLDETFDSSILNFGVINKVDFFIQYTVDSISGILVQNGEEFKDYPCELDIISEWKEEINEEELDMLAEEYSQDDALCQGVSEGYTCPGLIKAFKAGYRKAKEK